LAEAYCRNLLLGSALRIGERFNSDALEAFFDSDIPEVDKDMMKSTPQR
jgi:hypothetical protein